MENKITMENTNEFTNFLRKSDELTQQLSKDQLLAVIHEIARTLPEHKRESFWIL